jgi:hypothetical protein
MCIENCTIMPQAKFEIYVFIHVLNITLVDVLLHENINFQFVHMNTIALFCKFLNDKFITSSIATIVISV